MDNTIYIDVLFLLNIYISYFLFASTKKLLGVKISKKRMITACIVSGLYSAIILFEFSFIEFTIIKLLMGISLSAIAFYSKRIKLFLKATLMFFGVNFIYAGFMFCLWFFITPSTMQFKNGVVYFNISALLLAIFTIIAYGAISLFSYILNRRNNVKDIYDVTISFQGRMVMVTALLDTGNKLVDVFTGTPVMVCELSSLIPLLPEKLFNYLNCPSFAEFETQEDYLISKKIRVIPINVVSGSSSLMAFKPDAVIVSRGKESYNTMALVAVTSQSLSDGSFSCLISSAMLANTAPANKEKVEKSLVQIT